MDNCCNSKVDAIQQLRNRQELTLRFVLIVNFAMFLVEFVSGMIAESIALLADSLDMLGDALVYGFSLYVVSRDSIWKARAAVVKAVIMGLFGMFVLGQLLYKITYPQLPAYESMGVVGAIALAANAVCFALLWRHRAEDINMRSVWICSRNDLIANILVLIAAVGVWTTVSQWPDIVVGALICIVFFRSAYLVAQEARSELEISRARQPAATDTPSA
jgi:Co/Zn/Cd efflux system component